MHTKEVLVNILKITFSTLYYLMLYCVIFYLLQCFLSLIYFIADTLQVHDILMVLANFNHTSGLVE